MNLIYNKNVFDSVQLTKYIIEHHDEESTTVLFNIIFIMMMSVIKSKK